MTGIDRRGLLLAAFGLPLVLPGGRSAASARATERLIVSACAQAGGRFAARILAADGGNRRAVVLPGRGHGAAWRAVAREVVVLARRPGRFALVIDAAEGVVKQQFEAPSTRHFYGHGVFSRDGRWLFTTENDFEAGRGVIGVYDAAAGYRREAEIPSYGQGPHELALLSDGRRLVVANGGIRTHPDSGRRKLNIDTMSPNLAYIDSGSSALVRSFDLPAELHRLSIRHLAVSKDDQVCLALQNEGPRNRLVPLVGFQRGDEEIALAETPPAILKDMRHYCGSAALDESGAFLAVSAPRGGLVTFWALADQRYLASFAVADGCGVAAAGGDGRFLISSGQGRLLVYDVVNRAPTMLRGNAAGKLAWDNHLLAL
ncbi:DUF1513 domain-containing protein [Pelagibius litoralis]|uniref:DUF1513 domain-containing protein n=1 Tax=Pelagibius litoralis TaxID=374515 RepID=A0A967KG64_9PROT|nr:DUF1513 domain-containing protein [Pelagibius litoralis]NIA70096.1 DUF1513 domain-containing protein [Pelagibius litoralis]